MKFQRNARIFRTQLDVAPFASVLFLLLMFVLLGSMLYTPGVRLNLPVADGLPGTGEPTIAVAVDAGGHYYYRNQRISEYDLQFRLRDAVKQSAEPLTLVVHADRAVTQENLMSLALLASRAGIQRPLVLATLPRVFTVGSP